MKPLEATVIATNKELIIGSTPSVRDVTQGSETYGNTANAYICGRATRDEYIASSGLQPRDDTPYFYWVTMD